MKDVRDDLINKYSQVSKHSNYQKMPRSLQGIIGDEINVNSRYELERFVYIEKKINLSNKECLDIGGNTGYFTFELATKGAKHVDYFEGNPDHAEFVRIATKYLKLDAKINIHNTYYLFDGKSSQKYDVAFALNVLHHLGDDYGDKNLGLDVFKEQIGAQLNSMGGLCKILVLQVGFNWKGDKKKPIFEYGTKKEMIDFIAKVSGEKWNIKYIGIPVGSRDEIVYEDLSENNISRNDSLGEFLNRPIFIMESRGND